jgi:hypothetical protein
MSKITKTMLKSIVKECLVEILSEGLSSKSSVVSKNKEAVKKRKLEENRLLAHRQKFEVSIDNTVSTMTEDPIRATFKRVKEFRTCRPRNKSRQYFRKPRKKLGKISI